MTGALLAVVVTLQHSDYLPIFPTPWTWLRRWIYQRKRPDDPNTKGAQTMSSLEPYTSQPLAPFRSPGGGRLARQTARDLAAIDRNTDITSARIAAAGEIQQAKVDAVARTGAYAMQQVALVSQMQQQLALTAPGRRPGLHQVHDRHGHRADRRRD